MTDLEQNLKSYFGVIEKNDLQILSSFFQPEIIRKNEYFLKTDQSCNKLSFIKSGILRVYKTTEDKEITQWISAQGSFITDLASLFFESPARWNIQALTDCELYTINKKDYKKIGEVVPKWHELEKLFIAKCFVFLEDRIYNHLSMTAEERYNFFYKNNKELFNNVPLQYLASMLGMTPETLSRLRNSKK